MGSFRNGGHLGPKVIWGVNLLCHPYTPAREVFLNSQCRRDAARPARAAWAVQRLLAARWRGRRRRRRRFRLSDFRFEAAAAALRYGVSFATTRSQQLAEGGSGVLSLRHFGLVLFIPWRVGAEQAGAAKYRSMASAAPSPIWF